MSVPSVRTRIEGASRLAEAVSAGERIAAVFVAPSRAKDADVAALLDTVRERGGHVHVSGPSVLRRFSRDSACNGVIAVLGPDPRADLRTLLAARGVAWLLAGVDYAVNAGAALRTAEVSGADGVVVDAAFGAAGRRTALRAAMRVDRVMPVVWARAQETIDAALAASRRIVAVEDCGDRAPWQVDLLAPTLLVLGGEKRGLAPEVLARCDDVIRVPMAGFVPSYNVQGAMAAVASERLRRLQT